MKTCAICTKAACVCGCEMYEEDTAPGDPGQPSGFALFFVFVIGFICGVMFVGSLVAK